MGLCIVTYFYSKTNWMHNFRVYWISLCMFRTVFPSIIRSSRLYTQHQVYVIQVSWLLASGHEMELQFLMLCVKPWTPDDGRKDRPKHAEWYSVNSKIVHLVGFTIEIYHDARSHERKKDRPKHAEWYSINSKIVHLIGFTIEIYHDARSHNRQKSFYDIYKFICLTNMCYCFRVTYSITINLLVPEFYI